MLVMMPVAPFMQNMCRRGIPSGVSQAEEPAQNVVGLAAGVFVG